MTATRSVERPVAVDSDVIASTVRRGLPGLPIPGDEHWRYTPVEAVLANLKVATPAEYRLVSPWKVDALAGDHGGPRLVFVNGSFAGATSYRPVIEGLWCGPLAELCAERAEQVNGAISDRTLDGFHGLNHLGADDVAVVIADPGTVVDVPVHVVHVSAPGDRYQISHPRTIIIADESSRLRVIETFAGLDDGAHGGDGGAAFCNASTTIRLGADAALTYHRIEIEPSGTTHVGHTTVDQFARSALRATSVVVGADIARHAIDVTLQGPDASSDLDGVYLPVGEQRHDTAVTVDHTASGCSSTQRFTGVVDGRAHGSFSGRITVRPDTVATDAHQSNHNLVLTPTAQANTRPWLEILADDVQCTHGATVGRLDQDAVFYLRSRGIPLERARGLLIEAFVSEITETIGQRSLRDHVVSSIAQRTAIDAGGER